jgi:hypothetical protein
VERVRRDFLAEQIGSLEPFGYVLVTLPGLPEVAVEVERAEDGASFSVTVLARRSLTPDVVRGAHEAGLSGEPPRAEALDAGAAADLADRLAVSLLGAAEAAPVDLHHGTKREQVLTERKLAALRERIGAVLAAVPGVGPWTLDRDGDHTTVVGSTRLYVGPRALTDGTVVVLVFSPTSIGVEASPELGLFLAEANFRLVFGRFALDTDNGVVWFGQNLLGEGFTDEELAFVVRMVATTSDTFDEEIGSRFGGESSSPDREQQAAEAPAKPGTGGYL